MREDLDLVLHGTGAVAAAGAFSGVVLGSRDQFSCFDGGKELSVVEGSFVDSAMAAFAEKGIGGEGRSCGGDFGVVEVAYWFGREGFVLLEVRVAGGDCGLGITREVTHRNGFGGMRENEKLKRER